MCRCLIHSKADDLTKFRDHRKTKNLSHEISFVLKELELMSRDEHNCVVITLNYLNYFIIKIEKLVT